MMSLLAWSNIGYMLALIAGVGIHVRRSERKDFFYLRLGLGFTLCLFLAALLSNVSRNVTNFNYVLHLIYFAMVLVGTKMIFDLSWFYAINRCIFGWLTYCCGFVWGELTVDVLMIPEPYMVATRILVMVITYALFIIMSIRESDPKPSHFNDQFKMIITSLLAVITLAAVGVDFNFDKAYIFDDILYIMIIYLVLWLLNIFSEEKRIKDEYKLVKLLLTKEQQQYELSKEYIDLINVKCHDLKYQIYSLKNGHYDQESITEIETIVNNFDAEVKTGNEALDVILTEKSRYCAQANIAFTCIADGQKLNFMSQANIYSLIGNLLDNAIEAVERIEDKEKAFIDLKIQERSGVIHIRVENYYEQEIIVKNGLLATSKKEKSMHGFGTKSIQLIAEKYDGVVNFFTQDNVFTMDVLLPFTTE